MHTQHAFAILRTAMFGALQEGMAQPTGNHVTVQDNEGNEISMPEMHGGFVAIGEVNGWVAVLGSGIKPAFDAMIATVGQANAAAGSPVGLLLAVVDDDENESPDYSTLDITMPPEAKTAVDGWLNANGFDIAPNDTVRAIIDYTFGKFRDGFHVGEDYV